MKKAKKGLVAVLAAILLISLGGCVFVDRNGDPYHAHRLFVG